MNKEEIEYMLHTLEESERNPSKFKVYMGQKGAFNYNITLAKLFLEQNNIEDKEKIIKMLDSNDEDTQKLGLSLINYKI